nr:hypothetical protein [Neobacillus muris]
MQLMNNFSRQRPSMVYIMTNNDVMNQIIAYSRDGKGMLTYAGAYPTYGRGTGPKEVSTRQLTMVSTP